MERLTLFWDGPFSQWEPSYFVLDEVDYCCAEQYMMATKARTFGDHDTLEQIMDTEDPSLHKRLGRLVEGFSVEEWEEDQENGRAYCWNVVWRGNMAKFSQNPHLLSELLETAPTTLVEASPHDRLWGIGLRADDPRAHDRAQWHGSNWLGEVLTDVRAHLAGNSGPFACTTQLNDLLDGPTS